MINLLGDIAVFVGALAATAFVIAYHLSARWWKSEEGRHLMCFTGVIALALDYSSWRVVTAPMRPLPLTVDLIRTLLFAAIAALLVWRFWMLARRQIWAPWRRSSKRGR